MSNVRKNLAVKVETPGGDNPLLVEMVPSPPLVFRGIPCGPLAFVGRGGTPPYSFTVTTGSLPTGFPTLPINGDLTGSTATASGHFAFVVQIADFASNVFSHRFAIDVRGQLVVVADTPTPGEVGVAYTYQFVVEDLSGTRLTSGFSLHAGSSLPSWATLHSNGILDGTPDADGTTYFTVDATDGTDTISFACSITIYPLFQFASTTIANIIRGHAYNASIPVTGGVPPYRWSYGSVAAGIDDIVMDGATGNVSGSTNAAAGTYTGGVDVRDALGATIHASTAWIVQDANQYIQPKKNGSTVGSPNPNSIDLIEGTGVTITTGTSGGGVQYTINASGGSSYTPPVTTKGDLFGYSTVPARVPVGANDLPLVGDSSASLGVSYKVLPIDGGGSGQTTAIAAFGAFSPQTTKGDLIAYSTLPVRIAVGANDLPLVGDSSAAAGVSYKILPIDGGGTGLASTSQNFAFIGPTSGAGAPTWRALVAGDLPSTAVTPGSYGDGSNVSTFTVDQQGRLTAASSTPISILATGTAKVLAGGTGEDGAATFDGVNTFAFATRSGNDYLLTRNVCLSTVKITTGCTLQQRAFKAWAQTWDCRTGFYGKWLADGGAGGDASGSSAGAAGSNGTVNGTYFAVPPGNGTIGTAGSPTSSGSTSVSSSTTTGWGGNGGKGGRGGNSGANTSGTTGAHGSSSGYQPIGQPFSILIQNNNAGVWQSGTSGTGGSGGAGDGTNSGGGGGGGGAAGLGVDTSIGEIITDGSTPAGLYSCRGGKGGNGGTRVTGNVGGGGGAGGGSGGVGRLLVGVHTGPAVTNFLDCSGGDGGTGGAHAGTGADGVGGDGGDSGRVFLYILNTGFANGVYTPIAGTAASGMTAGTGGVGKVSLP